MQLAFIKICFHSKLFILDTNFQVVTLDPGVQCNVFRDKMSEHFLDELEECGYVKRL